MRSLVLHDYFDQPDGGGRLCTVLAVGLGADLGFGFARPGHPYLRRLPLRNAARDLRARSDIPLLRQLRLAQAFQARARFLEEYETVVYSGFYAPLAVHQHPGGGRNVYYCNTPPRFVYDQRDLYRSFIPAIARPLLHSFCRYLKPIYESAVAEMDLVIANSQNVRRRIRALLGIDSPVVHPPCSVERFAWRSQGDYYVSTARLDPLKRVHRIVEAFRHMRDKKLIVTSDGPQAKRLRAMARGAANISFTGSLDDEEMAWLLGGAIATLYIPRDEDFGLSPVESMAAGKPVIGSAEGGLLETVIHTRTGILLAPDPSSDDIIGAVYSLDAPRALGMRSACEQRAREFAPEIFLERMRGLLSPESCPDGGPRSSGKSAARPDP
jgi:glycosyltransferase involved in cell wall biosynthesis